jgi:UDP-N-acetylmuramate dehydrogenase
MEVLLHRVMFSEEVPLKEYTTMKTGGNARYFFVAKSIDNVKEAVIFAKNKKLPLFILGGGSNVIVSDDGFAGVVIKMEIGGINFDSVSKNTVVVTAGAGVEWDCFVKESVNKNLHGLENLSLIPGTVGAAPVQNIGAYGVEVGDVISFVEVLDTNTMKIKKISNEECLFGYRNSLFKLKRGSKFIILNVTFELKKVGELNVRYKDIEEYFLVKNIKPTLKTLRDAIIEIRTSKLPNMEKVGTAGSFFKNPIIAKESLETLLGTYPDLKYFNENNGLMKLSAAWLLDNVGKWKGVCIGDACVHEAQALVLINRGEASTKEIISFATEMQNNIKEKIGVVLEFEVVIL